MLVLYLYGKGPAVAAAAISSGCTYILWNHPYAIVIFTAETLFVSFLYKRKNNIVILDTVYWLFIGMPLVWLFYFHILGMDDSGTLLIMLKQSINGIFNALVAGIVYKGIRLHGEKKKQASQPLTFQNILFHALTGLVLFSSLTFWVIEVETHKNEMEKRVVQKIAHISANVRSLLRKFSNGQPHSSAGLKSIQDVISAVKEEHVNIIVRDPAGKVLIKAGEDSTAMDDLSEDAYGKRLLDRGVYQLIPKPEKGKSIMQRWNRSFYVKKELLASASGTWHILIQMPVWPQVNEMASETITTLSIVWILVMLCIAVSELISRMLSKPLLGLQSLAAGLPSKIADGKPIEWTNSAISEISNLSQNFKDMTQLLGLKFTELNEKNAALKKEIERRRHMDELVQHISEREKQKLGQDLHDGLGQILTGLAFRSEALEQKLSEKNMPEARDAAIITGLAGQATAYTKDLANMLIPEKLFENGFHIALQQLCSDAAKRFDVACYVTCRYPMSFLHYETSGNLYRIAQEAVTNAVKHGEAGDIKVELTEDNENIIMSISDNGTGLPEDWQNKKGLGLQIMRQRARMIGAKLNINRLPEKGTEVVCKVNLSARQETADE